MRTSVLFGTIGTGFFEIYGLSAWTRQFKEDAKKYLTRDQLGLSIKHLQSGGRGFVQ